jgi:hypothetical protein
MSKTESMDEFFANPSEVFLEGLTKEQLREVAEHYHFERGLEKGTVKKQGERETERIVHYFG